MLSEIQSLYEQSLFLDFTIKVSKKSFRVHKLVLVACSEYFRALTSSEMLESQKNEVELQRLSVNSVANMIHFMYYGKFETDEQDYQELLDCAVYLQVQSAIEHCVEMIIVQELCIDNCWDILEVFEKHNLKAGVNSVELFVRWNFRSILRICKNCEEVSVVERMLDLWERPEFEAFEFVTEWLDKGRKQYEQQLLSRIRYALMLENEVIQVKCSTWFRNTSNDWKHLVLRAEHYLNLSPASKKVVFYRNSEQNHMRGVPGTLAFYRSEINFRSHYPHDSIHIYDEEQGWWVAEFILDSTNAALAYAGAHNPDIVICANGFLIMSQQIKNAVNSDTRDTWTLFDPRTRTWRAIASPPAELEKVQVAAVYHGDHLYVLGGMHKTIVTENVFIDGEIEQVLRFDYQRSNTVERYSFKYNTWERLGPSSCLPVPMALLGACSMNDHIYIAGGQIEGSSERRLFLDRYQPESERWEVGLKEMLIPPHINPGPYYTGHVQLEKLDNHRLAYLSSDYMLAVYHIGLGTLYEVKIPYRNQNILMQPAHFSSPANCKLVVSNTSIYVLYHYEQIVCMYRPDTKEYREFRIPNKAGLIPIALEMPLYLKTYDTFDSIFD